MRPAHLWPALLLGAACATGCVARTGPYRFASPMLGAADVPPAWAGHGQPVDRSSDDRPDIAERDRHRDAMPPENRTTTERTHPVEIRVASAAAAEAIPDAAQARGVVWSRLPAPHKATPIAAAIAAGAEVPLLREPTDLRRLVGRRDKRDPFEVTFAWARALGTTLDPAIATGIDLVAWAKHDDRRASPTDAIAAGDLLVFDHTDGDAEDDLVAIAIGRDGRGVIEMIYLAGGAVRRGFLDPHRAATHRDATGAIVNTFLRAGKRWPPKGTHYLAGELIAHVIHTH